MESVPLPNVPLPISTLPTFSFGPKSDKSAEFINKLGNDFVFSSPIEVFPKVPLHNNVSKQIKSFKPFFLVYSKDVRNLNIVW